MFKFLAKIALTRAVPRIIDKVFDMVLGSDLDNEQEVKETKKRAPRDSSKFTQNEFDIIMAVYYETKEHNIGIKRNDDNFITQEDMTEVLNYRLGKHKVRSCYANIWNGKVSRYSLPKE